jgi:O-antigen/teichoic acid export membrane protein
MDLRQTYHLDLRTIMGLANVSLFKNSFFMAFTNIFNAGCGFFFWMIAARLYTVEEVGVATALISSLGMVILFSRLGFDSSIIRFLPSEDKSKVFSSSLILTTIASLLAGLAYIMLAGHLVPSLTFLKEPGCAIIFILIGAVNSVAAIAGSAFIADRKADLYLFQNVFMALRVPLLTPLVSLGTFGIFGSVGLSFLVASIFALVMLHKSLATVRLKVDWDFIGRAFKFSSWNYASNLLSVAPTLILPIMVLNMLGEASAAKYYIAFAIGNLVLIIPNSLGTSLFIEGSHGEGLKKSVIRAGAASIALLVPATLILCIFGGGASGAS